MTLKELKNYYHPNGEFTGKSTDGTIEIKGTWFEDRIPDEECQGYYKYEFRTTDLDYRLATIEKRVAVNFGGTLITEKPIDFKDSEYIEIGNHVIDGNKYQEFPEIFKEWNDVTDEELKLIKSKCNDMYKDGGYDGEIHVFKVNLTYEEANDLVDSLNEIDDNWFLGNAYEEYMFD